MVYLPEQYLAIPHVDLLSWVFGNPTYDQDKAIYIDAADDTRRLTARQALSCVRKLISGFRAHNLGPGDSVCLHSFNDILYPMLYLGIVGAGGCFVGSNPAHNFLELNHLFSISRAKFIIVEPELLENILPAARESGIPSSDIFIFNVRGQAVPNGFSSWKILLKHGESDWTRFDDEQKSRGTIAALFSTSGTSGMPKVAAISHAAHIATNIQSYDSKQKPYEITRLLCLPIFHAFCVPLAHVAPLREGHTTYIMQRFELGKYINAVSQFQITETAMVPPILVSLLMSSLVSSGSLASLRFIWCAGAPLDVSIQQQLANLLSPDAIISQNWGMTETSWVTSFLYPERDVSGSVGRLLPNMEAKLVDEQGNEFTKDSCPGEVYVRGPSLMCGYHGNPAVTQAAFLDGWLRTGDIAHCEKGKWYVVDRAKELIKVRGWQIAPSELEACLLTHPQIIDAAVIGITQSAQLGEVPRAYVVVDESSPSLVTEQEVKDYLGARLAKYKALDGGVKFVKSIPKSLSGKILKKILRNEARRECSGEDDHEGWPAIKQPARITTGTLYEIH